MAFWRSRVRSASGPPFSSLLFAAAFALAATLCLFVSVSAEHRLVLADGSMTVAFGFPVPWHWAGPDDVRVIHSGAALFDLLFYGLPVFLVLLRTHRFWFRHRRVAALASVVAMTVAAVGFRRAAGPSPTFAPATPASASAIVERSTTLRWGFAP